MVEQFAADGAFTARVCGHPTGAVASTRYVERFIDLLWNGIGDEAA